MEEENISLTTWEIHTRFRVRFQRDESKWYLQDNRSGLFRISFQSRE